jgi:hypothetical protein
MGSIGSGAMTKPGTDLYGVDNGADPLTVVVPSFSLKSIQQSTPPLSAQAHACTASFCVFFFYRPTGRPRRTSLPLECHRNATNRTRFVSKARHSTSR